MNESQPAVVSADALLGRITFQDLESAPAIDPTLCEEIQDGTGWKGSSLLVFGGTEEDFKDGADFTITLPSPSD